jgi:hypothetical protein
MRKVGDVLRLSAAGMSKRKIAASLGVSATAARDCIGRARCAGISWPLPEGLTDEALDSALPAGRCDGGGSSAATELGSGAPRVAAARGDAAAAVGGASRRPPGRLRYSRFCELYRAWEARLSPTMRQSHVAGERMVVDYAGTTLEVIDASTGVARTAQLFVATLGASSYTYAEATWTQGLSDWIGSHTRSFWFGLALLPSVIKHQWPVPTQGVNASLTIRWQRSPITVYRHRHAREPAPAVQARLRRDGQAHGRGGACLHRAPDRGIGGREGTAMIQWLEGEISAVEREAPVKAPGAMSTEKPPACRGGLT